MSKAHLDPYLFFTGNCREAMAFYHSVFGGDLSIMDMPGEQPAEGQPHVMHAYLHGGLVDLMASDGTRTEPYPQGAVSLSISGEDEAQLKEVFTKLSEGGTAIVELKQETWGAIFGSFTDKYGIDWLININPAPTA